MPGLDLYTNLHYAYGGYDMYEISYWTEIIIFSCVACTEQFQVFLTLTKELLNIIINPNPTTTATVYGEL